MRGDTLWPVAAHTQAKHDILRSYLGGWFPIMGSRWDRLLYVDGFAGPGEYLGGEPGSPRVALDVAVGHARDLSRSRLDFLFVEERPDRAEHLRELLARDHPAPPAHIGWEVRTGTWAEHIAPLLDAAGPRSPALVMVDPFGVEGVTLDVIRRLAAHRYTEVLVSMMYQGISRWMLGSQEPYMDGFFGGSQWRECAGLPPDEKRRCLHDLYQDKLREAGYEHVRSFQMVDEGGNTEYYLFFGTHGDRGLEVMKDAMWRVDPSGTYRFRDATHPDQLTLFAPEPDYHQLRQLILTRFARATVTIDQVERFVLVDTAFKRSHLRTALRPPEEAGELAKQLPPGKRNRRGHYPPGTRITFPG